MEIYRALMPTILHLTIILILNLYHIEGRMRVLSAQESMELDRELASLNKPSMKTIKTKYGDVYDCVDLYKQPAFDNPLLKDHKIQLRPSFKQSPDVSEAMETKPSSTTIDSGLDDKCPSGTVPIRRTTKKELIAAKTHFKEHSKGPYLANANELPKLFFAGLAAEPRPATVYHGATGYVSICNPAVGLGQLSASAISLEGGPPDLFSVIRVGWMVNINLFQDNLTRLYTIWGQSIGQDFHGCYNIFCSGFVQTDISVSLGMVLEPVSIVRGPQYYVKLSVIQDKATGNWWLLYGETNKPIGYWSNSLFTNLKDGAETINWGGMVYGSAEQVPPMGNGDNGKLHSSHFRQIAVQYESGSSLNGTKDVPLNVRDSKCYKAGDNSYKGEFWGYSFYYGGNGGTLSQCS